MTENCEYSLETVKPLPESPLMGKRLCFLGSSVTRGSAADGLSFADYIGKRNSCTVVKEATDGTTLTDIGENSYIRRMKTKLSVRDQFDLFICQLSTNDASQNRPLGNVDAAVPIREEELDCGTVAGAIESILLYVRRTWRCPVWFYTNPRFESKKYAEMVDLLYRLKEKWGIGIIDLWNDEEVNAISADKRRLYLHDPIHPTRAGYLEWWTPAVEKYLYDAV